MSPGRRGFTARDAASSDAKYPRIMDDIRDAIRRGDLQPGDPLPSIAALQAAYDVTAVTAARALHALAAEGLITTRIGVGSHVRERQPATRVVSGPPNPDDLTDGTDPDGHVRLVAVTVDQHPAPSPVADALHLPTGTVCVRRRHLIHVDGRPAQLAEAWYPPNVAQAAPVIAREQVGPDGVWACLADAGHAPAGEVVERWSVRPATPEEAASLELARAARVMQGWRVARDAAGDPVEVTRMVLAEGAYVLEFRVVL